MVQAGAGASGAKKWPRLSFPGKWMSSPPRLLGDAAVESSKMNIQRTFGFGKRSIPSYRNM
jgi:hypothetical protein